MTDLDFSVYTNMPEVQKKQLCLELLSEFGASVVNETTKGELQHACTLPLPGHSDRNSITASINYKKLTFHCFVCGNAGGLLWWIAVNRRESVEESKNWLRDASGIGSGMELPVLMEILNSLFHPVREERIIPTFDERVLDPWTSWRIHHPYLTLPWSEGGREIPDETLDNFKIGYCDRDIDWGYYQRIIIPIRWRDKLVGWQARKLAQRFQDDPEPAKYKNSPDLPRDRVLYGNREALSGPELVVVESPMSVLRHAHHLALAATLGASVSDMQVPLLHQYRRVVLWLDNDEAGWNALQGTKNMPGLIERLRPYVEVRVVQSPWLKADPADLTDLEAAALVESAVPAVLWKRPKAVELQPYARS